MEKLKVLVVDDSAVYRKILAAAVENSGMAVVEQNASNGVLALERLQHGKYDVVLLDVNMPEMDGIEALKRIRQGWPELPVIMISSSGGKNAAVTLKALEIGALDFILKPLDEDYTRNMEIVRNYLKVLFAQIQMKNIGTKPKIPSISTPATTQSAHKTKLSGVDLVVIASSTGGPVALETIFEGFGSNFHKPMLIVQHMPPDFTRVLAESLDKKSRMRFVEGREGDIIRAGQGIIAPGGMHMIVANSGRASKNISLTVSEHVNGVRPSADVLFKSVADEYQGARVLSVVLTGMGNDGLEGVKELKKKCTCYCITQSEQTCVVYGMPRCVSEAGLSDEVVDLGTIAGRIQHITEYGS